MTGSMKGDQPVSCMDNIRTHIGYEERLDRARTWVLNSTDTKCAPFEGTTPEVLTRKVRNIMEKQLWMRSTS
jgi:hypothetical protein